MDLIAHPSRVAGRASVPASKSHTIRAAFFAALADGESVIEAPLASADADAALDLESYRKIGKGCRWCEYRDRKRRSYQSFHPGPLSSRYFSSLSMPSFMFSS